MNKVIKINDYPCGSGKTTRMIEGFRPENKYLVILPSLSEVDRVIEGARDIEFVQPHANDNDQGTKTSSLEAILHCGGCCAGKFVQPSAQLVAENWKILKDEKKPTSVN